MRTGQQSILGAKGQGELHKPEGEGYLEVIGGNYNVNAVKAEKILEWTPNKKYFLRHTFICENLELYI